MNQIMIGKFIAFKRKQKNLTQEQLAQILNISNKTVYKWETGCKSQYKDVGFGQYNNVGFPTLLYWLFSLHPL